MEHHGLEAKLSDSVVIYHRAGHGAAPRTTVRDRRCQEHRAQLHPSTPSGLSMTHLHINTASLRTLFILYSAPHVQIRFV